MVRQRLEEKNGIIKETENKPPLRRSGTGTFKHRTKPTLTKKASSVLYCIHN